MSEHNMATNQAVSTIWAERALTALGWARRVAIDFSEDGLIRRIEPDCAPTDTQVGILLPSPANLHSHAFQRSMAGLAEKRTDPSTVGVEPGKPVAGRDSFWTWRKLMYQFLDHLNPDDVQSISAFTYMQMLEAGFSAVAEFHYLHHQPDGCPYTDPAEMANRVAAAAAESGIGLTLLPVLYQQGGCDGRALGSAQKRFGHSLDQFSRLLERTKMAVGQLANDCLTGAAAHSLRAVPADAIQAMPTFIPGTPVHIHIAEQTAEVLEVVGATGLRPVEWLLHNVPVDERWCLIHATHMTPDETAALANSGAVAGLCPITEANLGDGIFDGERFVQAGGAFGIGSDSNIRISVSEELRMLEYSQRLRHHARTVLCDDNISNGLSLWKRAAHGGARALGRDAGEIALGRLADLVALDGRSIELAGLGDDDLLDSAIFASGDNLVTDVWSAGRHLVQNGHHIHHGQISSAYRATMERLRGVMAT